jgi:hypothetical protein
MRVNTWRKWLNRAFGLTRTAPIRRSIPLRLEGDGGSVVINSDGSFTYTPVTGHQNLTDKFTYTVTDGDNLSSTGTVSINLGPRVWYVDNTAPNGGDGSFNSRYNSLAAVSGAAGSDTAGDIIYVFSTGTAYNGNMTLLNNEQLIGGGTALTVNGVTVVGAGANTSLTTTAANTDAVTLASGNTVKGFTIGDTTGAKIVGSSFGTLTISNVTLQGSGQDLNLNTGTANGTIDSLSSNSSTTAVSLTGIGGGLTITTGAISGATGDDFVINGGAGTMTYGGTITNSSGHSVNVQNKTAGTVTFSGAITDTSGSTGILVNSNTGATIDFTGGLSLTTTTNAAFTATGGGTVNVTGGNNTITTTTGTALDVANTTIGSSNLTFKSISANGGANGIVLNNTGSSGGLTVTGDGSNSVGGDSSGGTLQHITTSAIQLTNTQNVSLNNMNIQTTTRSGINGTGVTNFSFTNGTINQAGAQNADACIAFNTTNFSGAQTQNGDNINGTLTVTGSVLSNGFSAGLDVQSDSGTVTNANISNNSVSNPGAGTAGISLVGTGNASTSFSLLNATIDHNTVTNAASAGIQVSIGNSNASGPGATAGIPNDSAHVVSITNNAVSLKTTGTNAIIVANSGGNSASRTHTNFIISGNGRTAALGGSAPGALGSSSIGTVILIGNNGFSTMTGTVDSNVITASHTPNLGGGNGIAGGNGVAGAGNAWTPDLTLTVTNNTISGTDGNGILLASRGGTGTARLKVADNTAAAPVNAGGVAAQGIRVDAGNAKSANDSVFLNIRGNTSAGSNGASGIGVRKQGTVSTTNVFGIFDAPGDPTTLRANPHQDSGYCWDPPWGSNRRRREFAPPPRLAGPTGRGAGGGSGPGNAGSETCNAAFRLARSTWLLVLTRCPTGHSRKATILSNFSPLSSPSVCANSGTS